MQQLPCAKRRVDDRQDPIAASFDGPQSHHQLVEAVPVLVLGSEIRQTPPASCRNPPNSTKSLLKPRKLGE